MADKDVSSREHHESDSTVEETDDRLRKAREIFKSGMNWARSHKRGLVERYTQGHFKFAVRLIDSRPGDYGVIVEARPFVGEFENASAWPNTNRDRRKPNRDESLVLAENVELVESDKTIIPSWIRLQRFENAPLIGNDPLFAFLVPFRINEVNETIEDGKIDPLTFRYSVAMSKGTSQKIETASYTIDDGADLRIDDERKRFYISNFVEAFSHFRVGLDDHSIRFVVSPGGYPLLQNWHLRCGPIDGSLGI